MSDKQIKILTKKEKGNHRHWKNFVDKDYLGSHNLEKGEEMFLTISQFEGEEMVQRIDGEKEPMRVLYFSEKIPKMIVNNTNANIISALYGTQPEKWIGKQIQIYATPVKAFGKMQDALRIRDFVPSHQIETKKYIEKFDKIKTMKELREYWYKLPMSVRNDAEMKKVAKSLKAKFEK